MPDEPTMVPWKRRRREKRQRADERRARPHGHRKLDRLRYYLPWLRDLVYVAALCAAMLAGDFDKVLSLA